MSSSPIGREVRQCMSEPACYPDGRMSARFLFPPGFIGFRGHFPGRPVLAAVCQVEAVAAMLEHWKQRPVKIERILFAKFLLPVSAGEEVVFECRERVEADGRSVVTALATRRGAKAAEIRIGVRFGDEG